MSVSKRLPVALGGLGAVVVLGLGASFAAGGEQSKTDHVRSALHSGKPKNVILFLGDGMGSRRSPRPATTSTGCAGRMNMDRLPQTGFQTTWSVKPGRARPTSPTTTPTRRRPARSGRPARRRSTSGSPRVRAPPRTCRARTTGRSSRSPRVRARRSATSPPPRSPTRPRQCWPPTSRCAAARARTTRDDLPHRDQGCRRPRLDRRTGGRPQGGRGVRRRPRPVPAADRRRPRPTNVVESALAKGYRYVTNAAGLAALKPSKPVLGLFSRAT